MARIYVSSTYGDLKAHREQAYRSLRQLGHDVIAMEDYVATDQRPLAKCLEDVAISDVYIGILAHRYGYVPHPREPREAFNHRVGVSPRSGQEEALPGLPARPRGFLACDLDGAFTGDNEGGGRIRALREEIGRDHLVSFFATAEELAQKVSVAVTNQLKDQQVTGQPAVPSGRGWTIPPPVRSFTGRDDLLAALGTQLTTQAKRCWSRPRR